jgi:hypothetical protein
MGKKGWKLIPIKGGFKAKIDSEDYARVSEHKWYKTTARSGRMSVVTNLKIKSGYKQVTLGKFLMKPPRGKYVYPRRFMEGFDYRKDNLIVCTMAQRQQMLPKSRHHGSSHYKGVSYSTRHKCWQVGLQNKGKTINLGLYKTEHEAAEAYNRAARRHFGEFAYQNQIQRKANRRTK